MLSAARSPPCLLLPTSPRVAFPASAEVRRRRVPAARTPKLAAEAAKDEPVAASQSDVGSPPSSPLTGSDVLRALQRAVAAKEARQGKKWSPARRISDGRGGGRQGRGSDESCHDYSHVRPIEVRSHWAQRIDELERRIQELKEKYR